MIHRFSLFCNTVHAVFFVFFFLGSMQEDALVTPGKESEPGCLVYLRSKLQADAPFFTLWRKEGEGDPCSHHQETCQTSKVSCEWWVESICQSFPGGLQACQSQPQPELCRSPNRTTYSKHWESMADLQEGSLAYAGESFWKGLKKTAQLHRVDLLVSKKT